MQKNLNKEACREEVIKKVTTVFMVILLIIYELILENYHTNAINVNVIFYQK